MAENVENLDDHRGGEDDAPEMPTNEQLESLYKTVSAEKAKMDEARGKVGSAYKTAGDDHNVHGPAFKMAMKLRDMEETKRDSWLTHFDEYRASFQLDEGRTAELFAGAAE